MRALAQLALLVVVSAVLPTALASNFTWTWPTTTAQCDTISMDIYGGVAPWTLFIIPVDGVPILWNLGATTDTANETVPATFTLPLALNASTDYVVYIEDSEPGNEYNVQGNPKEVQSVQSSGDDSCMSGVKIVEREFYFTVGGDSVPCGQMGIFYDDAVGRGPYSLTIIPLDGSFHPYDVSIGNTTSSTFYWGLQLEEGTRYTMMMSYNGHGVGGVASIYSVGALPSGTTASCIAGLDFQPTGTWPSAVYTTAVGALTASVSTLGGSATSDTVAQSQTATTTSAPASSSSSSSGSSGATGTGGKKSNAGVIGGAVGGVVGGLLILAAIGWFFFRRRKYQRVSAADGQPPRPTTGGRVDLGDDYAQAEEGDKVVPFPSPLPTSSQQQQQQQQPPMQQRESYGYNTSAYVLPTDQPGIQHPSQSHLYPSTTGDGAQNLGLATIPLGYSSPSQSQSQSLSQSQSQSQSQSGSSNAWGQSPTSPSAPGGVADASHGGGGTRNSKMMQEYLRQTTFLPPGAAPTTSPPPGAVPGAAPAGAPLVSDVSGAGRGVPSPHSPPSSAGPWSHHDPVGQDDPEIILHQDGGAVPTHQQQEQVGQRERIELPPTYSQASGQQ